MKLTKAYRAVRWSFAPFKETRKYSFFKYNAGQKEREERLLLVSRKRIKLSKCVSLRKRINLLNVYFWKLLKFEGKNVYDIFPRLRNCLLSWWNLENYEKIQPDHLTEFWNGQANNRRHNDRGMPAPHTKLWIS